MKTEPQPQLCFEDVQVGDLLPAQEFGPLTIVDSVRWLGFQENPSRTHCDRDYVRQHHGIPTFIASGAYRQALLTRTITDWIGARGVLRKMSVRQTFSTFEGDMMRFSGRVLKKASGTNEFWIECELDGRNQDGRQIVAGSCVLELPSRALGAAKI